MYTSGSSGSPKGATLSDRMLHEELCIPSSLSHVSIEFVFQSLAYSSGRIQFLSCIGFGGRMHFFSGAMQNFFSELQEASPDVLSAPPRIWNFLYNDFRHSLIILII